MQRKRGKPYRTVWNRPYRTHKSGLERGKHKPRGGRKSKIAPRARIHGEMARRLHHAPRVRDRVAAARGDAGHAAQNVRLRVRGPQPTTHLKQARALVQQGQIRAGQACPGRRSREVQGKGWRRRDQERQDRTRRAAPDETYVQLEKDPGNAWRYANADDAVMPSPQGGRSPCLACQVRAGAIRGQPGSATPGDSKNSQRKRTKHAPDDAHSVHCPVPQVRAVRKFVEGTCGGIELNLRVFRDGLDLGMALYSASRLRVWPLPPNF